MTKGEEVYVSVGGSESNKKKLVCSVKEFMQKMLQGRHASLSALIPENSNSIQRNPNFDDAFFPPLPP